MRGELGLALIAVGASLALTGYAVLNSIPLLILGISTCILGLLASWGEGAYEPILTSFARIGWRNTAALLEEIGVSSKAVYLPSSYSIDGDALAFIPLGKFVTPPPDVKLPKAFTIDLGNGFSGILLATPGTEAVRECKEEGGIQADVGTTLTSCLVVHLAIAKSVTIAMEQDVYKVALRGLRIADLFGDTILKAVLGSSIASIVASLSAESLNRPIIVESEYARGKDYIIELRAL